ncbi:MAG TPA: TIGR03016 family PEP-CTERM system-associated outer membrane protein [Gammaproteobacteria bacterium]
MINAGRMVKSAAGCMPARLPRFVLACMVVFVSRHAVAEFIPEISVAGIYSDNITLSRSEENKEGDFVTQISPGFRAFYDSKRLRLDANYRMQGLLYNENSDSNETFHQLDSQVQTRLPANFNFDAAARASQQVINPEQGLVASNIPINRNFTDVVTLRASPYWEYVGDSGMRTLLRYTRGEVDYALEEEEEDEDIEDSSLRRSQFSTGMNEGGQRLQWSLDYIKDEVEFESGMINIFEQAALQLGILLGRKTVFFVTRGEEDNTFIFDPSLEPPTGPFWNAGFRWISLPKDSFEIFGGERYFGDYYGMSWNHAGRYINVDMEFSQELFTDAQSQLGANTFINGRFIERNLDRPVTDVYLSDQLSLAFELERALTSIRFAVRGENREFQSTGEQGRIRVAELEWGVQLSARQRLIVSLDSRQDRLVGDEREDILNRLRTGITRELGPRTTAGIMFLRAEFESDFPGIDYIENALSLSFTRIF